MSKKQLISVIIPTYNRANVILNAIKSVENQTFSNWEILIIDDGSTDNTYDIVKPFLKNKKIRYYYQENNGVCSARNYGIKKAKGDYLSFLDSDDSFLESKLKTCFNTINKVNADLVLCNIFEYRENKMIKNRFNFTDSFFVSSKDIVNYKVPMSASFIFIKKRLAEIILFDVNLSSSNDFDFVLRSSNQGKIYFLNERLVNNFKTTKIKRISTNYPSKINGYKKILEKIKYYKLDSDSEKQLKMKTMFNLYLFYWISKDKNNALTQYFNLIKEFPETKKSIKVSFIYLCLIVPLLSEVVLFFSKLVWSLGIVQN